MLGNYLTVALRNIKRNKTFSIINIAGLSISMAACLFIVLYVQSELSYDKFHTDYKRVFRIETTKTPSNDKYPNLSMKFKLLDRIMQNIPEVEAGTRIEALPFYRKVAFSYNDKALSEEGQIKAEPSFFNIFNFKAVYGNLKTALNDPNSIIINESISRKYFGGTNPVGKNILIESFLGKENRVITAVLEDVPVNTHLQFTMITPVIITPGNENNSNYHTYLKIKDNVSAEYVLAKVKKLVASDYNKSNRKYDASIKNIADIHLNASSPFEIGKGGSKTALYVFSSLALLIILLACINYINLTTNGAIKRFKEIGIRKTIGADKIMLIKQFIGESVLYSLLAMAISFLIVLAFFPLFKNLAGIEISLGSFFTPFIIIYLLSVVIITGIFAGAYPAFYLSNLRPAMVINNKLVIHKRVFGLYLTRGLVVFQFVITSAMIIGTIIILKQLNFAMNKDLGYNKEQLLVVDLTTCEENADAVLKEEFKIIPQINSMALTSFLPDEVQCATNFVAETENGKSEALMCKSGKIDPDFLSTYGIKLTAGKNITEYNANDESGQNDQFLLNETAVKYFNLKDPVGKKFGRGSEYRGVIAGVVKDFYFTSMHEEIKPLVMHYNSNPFVYLSCKINTENLRSTIGGMKKIYNKVFPDKPFEYYFFDEKFNKMYQADLKFLNTVETFSFISIFIACIGLFGQVLYSTEARKKEIGIRKTLGANIKDILRLVSKEFVAMVVIANIIAIPLSYYTIKLWLNSFAYKTIISWWIYALALVISLIIAAGIMSYQTIKAATANPVDAIRCE